MIEMRITIASKLMNKPKIEPNIPMFASSPPNNNPASPPNIRPLKNPPDENVPLEAAD